MRAILAVALLLQAAPAQSEADKTEAALKKFGERTYLVTENGKESGKLVLKVRVEKSGDLKQVVFEGRAALKHGDEEGNLLYGETASLDGLRLASTHRVMHSPDGKMESRVTIKDGKALMTGDREESTIEVGPNTLGEFAILAKVCAAEQKKDSAFKVDVLNLTMPGHEPGHAFTCLGKEEVVVGGKKIEAFKWEEKGEWEHKHTINGQEMTLKSKADNKYWVHPDGYLLRFTYGRSEMVLDAK